MVGKTITRTELCEAVYRSSGRSRSESLKLFELVLEQIAECLKRGERVKLFIWLLHRAEEGATYRPRSQDR